jgi:outer membrane biosynthesis protein TonB
MAAALISSGAACSVRAAGAPPGSASLAYQNRASDIFVRAVLPALVQRLDQLLAAGATKVYYRIRADGQVESVRVVSARPNRFVQDTCARVLKSTKFPSIPEAVRRELKKNHVDMSSEFGG